jgi:transglutaminase-like putative cysteine protease
MTSPPGSHRSPRGESQVRPERPTLAVRSLVFAGLAAIGLWHISRLQSPSLGVGDLTLQLILACALAAATALERRVFALSLAVWVVAVAGIVGHRFPSRNHPLATFTAAWDLLDEGASRFASVVLPVDPVAEPGVHGLVLAATCVWLAGLALIWLVAARPLPTIVLAALPVAIVSSEFALPRPGLRVALLVGFMVATLAVGRRAEAGPVVALGAPLVLAALVAGGVPGLARAALFDWRAWGTAGASNAVATDVRYAWDQSYDGLHYKGEPVVVLHVRSPRPSYWRVTVLDAFDGSRFEEREPAPAPAAAGGVARVEPTPVGRRTRVQVEVDALGESYLVGAGVPVSYRVPESTGGGTIDANGVVRVLRPPPHGSRYTLSAVIADPTPATLRHPSAAVAASPADGLDSEPFSGEPAVPAFGTPDRAASVSALLARRPAWRLAYAWAERATASARTPYDAALALERTLRTTHPYNGAATLSPGDPDALARWIVSGASGYCQMFSASMAELLRLLGVPARVTEGFTTGTYDTRTRSYVVDDRDAHAWVEAWLPGSGWVPFDPTPGRYLPNQASSSSVAGGGSTAQSPKTPARSNPGRPAQPATPSASAPSISSRASSLTRGDRLRWGVAILAALALLAAAAWALVRAAGFPGRPRGPRAEVRSSRARLARRARRRGLALAPGTTNGELAAVLGSRLDLDTGAWVEAADRAAYAPFDEALAVLPALRDETRRLRRAIRASRRVTIPG